MSSAAHGMRGYEACNGIFTVLDMPKVDHGVAWEMAYSMTICSLLVSSVVSIMKLGKWCNWTYIRWLSEYVEKLLATVFGKIAKSYMGLPYYVLSVGYK